MSIQFKPCRGDGDTDEAPWLKGVVYMNVETTDEFKSTFSGWVSPQVRALVYAAPGLQRKVYDYEKMIGRLLALLKGDDLDGAMDVVRAEYEAIHGPDDESAFAMSSSI